MPDIHHKTYIKVLPNEVYTTLTTADGWNAWFTDSTSLHISSDGTGEIRLRWDKFGENMTSIVDGGKILEAIPNEKFAFQWSPGEGYTTVVFTLESYKSGTLLQLQETGYSTSTRDIGACLGCAVGWGEALTLLKMYLEHGIVCKQDLL